MNSRNSTKSIGSLLLAIWLILTGLAAFFPIIGALRTSSGDPRHRRGHLHCHRPVDRRPNRKSNLMHDLRPASAHGISERPRQQERTEWLTLSSGSSSGEIIGWVASQLTGSTRALLLNIVVGIVGAFIAGYILTPFLHVGTINQNNFSVPALLVSLLGAIILLVALSVFRRGGMRLR